MSTITQTVISTLHLLPSWINRLLEDCENEAESHQNWTIKMIEGDARKVVWTICSLLGVGGKGVPGLACRLMEQYLAVTFQKKGQMAPCDYELEEVEDWDEFMELLSRELPLLTATCAQLAAKMSSVSAVVDLKNVRNVLMQRDVYYTLREIIEAEYKVLGALDYRIPLWTSHETAELLAVDVGIPLQGLSVVGFVVNLAEFYRPKVDRKVQWVAHGSPGLTSEHMPVRSLHLCAGAVAAASRVLAPRAAAPPAPRLAARTRLPQSYITCIADAILECVFAVED